MLEKVDLDKSLGKDEARVRIDKLREELVNLQRACRSAGIPAIVVFEGWDAAGKGSSINLLAQRLDPRGFKLHATHAPRKSERAMPWLWRFWQRLPNYGEMAIFDRSWYGRVMVERVEKMVPKEVWREAFRDIVDFERALADDGYLIIKFFLHISKKEQKKRFQKLEKDPLTRWRVAAEDWEHHRKYDKYRIAIEEMLEQTNAEWAPWTIVEATDPRWSRVKMLETIVTRLQEALVKAGKPLPATLPAAAPAKKLRRGPGRPRRRPV